MWTLRQLRIEFYKQILALQTQQVEIGNVLSALIFEVTQNWEMKSINSFFISQVKLRFKTPVIKKLMLKMLKFIKHFEI